MRMAHKPDMEVPHHSHSIKCLHCIALINADGFNQVDKQLMWDLVSSGVYPFYEAAQTCAATNILKKDGMDSASKNIVARCDEHYWFAAEQYYCMACAETARLQCREYTQSALAERKSFLGKCQSIWCVHVSCATDLI